MNPFGGHGPIGHGGAGGVATPPTAHRYLHGVATSVGDPNVILTTPATASGDDIIFVIDTPSGGAAAATLPSATTIGGAYVEFLMKDLDGATITLLQSDPASFWAWYLGADAWLPLDTFIAICITGGGVGTIGNSGTVHGLRGTATGNEGWSCSNAGAGAGWTAPTAAGTIDALVSGIKTSWSKGVSNQSVARNSIPIDASGDESLVIGTTAANGTANTWADGPMSHVAVMAGWYGAGGGTAPLTIPVSLRGRASKIRQLDDFEPDRTPADVVITDPPLRILVMGESNGNGTQIDPTYGDDTIPADWTQRLAGVNTAAYLGTANPSTGPLPRLVELAVARGAAAGTRWIARRATNGITTAHPGSINGVIANAIADVVALGGDAPHIIVWVFGANDSTSAALAAEFAPNMRKAIRIMARRFPLCPQVLYLETTAGGIYTELATIQAAILALRDEFAGRVYVANGLTAPAAELFDDVHWTPAGHVTMANRAFAALYGA